MKFEVLYRYGFLLPENEFRQILESLEGDEVLKLATLFRVGKLTPKREELIKIETACNQYEVKLKLTMEQIRTGES